MKRYFITITVLFILLCIGFIWAVCSGSINIGAGEIASILSGKSENTQNYHIIMDIRLPRILFALIVGGMLGISGAILQGILKNPLVDPYITGISSGAALGASIFIIMGVSSVFFPAMAGALLTMFMVYRLSIVYGKMNITSILLIGIMAGSFFSSLVLLLSAVFNRDIVKVMFWLLGDLSGASVSAWPVLLLAGVFGAAVYFANDLNILMTGEEEAKTVGVNTEFIKTMYFIIASLLTGIAVALSGVIGFVGLVIPHVLRFFTGADMRLLIPSSFLAGGFFLLVSDTLARTVFLPGEIPVGIVTGLIGAPVFIFLLLKRGRPDA